MMQTTFLLTVVSMQQCVASHRLVAYIEQSYCQGLQRQDVLQLTLAFCCVTVCDGEFVMRCTTLHRELTLLEVCKHGCKA